MFNTQSSAAQQYSQNNAYGALNASPHQLISLLMKGAIDRLTIAKGHASRNEHDKRSKRIGQVTDIIDCLRDSLNHKYSEEMTQSLEQLYDYMCFRLFSANSENDITMIDEVIGLMSEIYSAWEQIDTKK